MRVETNLDPETGLWSLDLYDPNTGKLVASTGPVYKTADDAEADLVRIVSSVSGKPTPIIDVT